ncbi:D-alanyl-D-alanine carboxypeptidase family protein [Selenomonas sp.]|uniref:D-alanyl-D-alanine carboxypeptidase family protein n=1 Tax=Selenomonas sp. TaxID=2053611 RepID=UPI00260046CB|nr:D-alanyl-D-alanine carboxypeptidase family protein [Selenomonas sp.]MCI6283915.1 D-alanyl-D-alanine carboxypeptidase [Selenomonas sp.]
MRKLLIVPVIAVITVLFSVLFASLACAAAADAAPTISAQSAIVIEASTGRVIYEKDADAQRSPASMTKIMTCLLALDLLGRHQNVIISQNAYQTEDCPLEFSAGDLFTADELLRGMMLVSDNGAAVALAETASGSVAKFVDKMNDEAKALGMTDTHFANPNGLTNAAHYSTARDMAKLARHAMTRKDFRDIVSIEKAPIRWELPRNKVKMVENSNELLGHYDGMTGIKTGWTQDAGGCLAASARRNGLELIAIVMKAPDPKVRFDDARKLLDYGFAQTRLKKGISRDRLRKSVWVKGAKQATVAVHPATDVNYPIIKGEDPKRYTVTYDLPKVLEAPVAAGTPVGKIILRYDGKSVGSVDLLAEQAEQGFSLGSAFVSVFGWLLPRL